MTIVDWSIVVGMYCVLFFGAMKAGRRMQGVADYLSAGRTAGRYLLAIASGMAGLGGISIIRDFQMNYEAGFAMSWWGMSMAVVVVVLAVTGWVNYRFRATRCLTLAEFFERRYSRRFRIFAGLVAFGAGIINFGIFPAVEARFFMHFIHLPERLQVGPLSAPTYPLVMLFLLGTAVFFVFRGGQVTAMMTSFLQGAFANVVFVGLAVFLLLIIPWRHISDVLTQVPPGHSKINPFDTGYVETFNFRFFIIGVMGVVYNAMSWQGTQGYNSSAKSAHEAKMGMVIGTWRGYPQSLLIMLLPILIFVVMHHAAWGDLQTRVDSQLSDIANLETRSQMRVPVALAGLLPAGLLGAFAALMLCASISTQSAYMHSWSSILIQDVILPLRRKPISPRGHLMLLRISALGVAAFTFVFALCYEQNQAIALFLALTGAIFAGWSGAVIIGGLYWRRGTTEGAWAAAILGIGIALGGLVLASANTDYHERGRTLWGVLNWLGEVRADAIGAWLSSHLPNGQELWGLAMPCCLATYVVVSLIYRPRKFELDGLLHRDKYAVETCQPETEGETSVGWRVLGMNRYFSRRDKFLYISTYLWTAAWVIVFAVGTVYMLTVGSSGEGFRQFDAGWMRFWQVYVWIQVGIALTVVIWFTIGGFKDIHAMLQQLRTMKRDVHDDGIVREEKVAQ